MNKITRINNEAVAYALKKCKENPDHATWGDFDQYHSDYLSSTGEPIEILDKVCDEFAKYAYSYKAQFLHTSFR